MSDLRQCPFDALHQVAAKKFASHLVKCRRQHPDVKLVSCHFDTSHLMKEENLREHMKTCSGRKDLLQYKITVNRAPAGSEDKLPDPADDLIYNTDAPSHQKETGGNTLQDDSECWDDFAYKAYDPLENCKSKLQNNKGFMLPNANRFVGQMQAAASLKEEPVEVVASGSLVDQVAETESVGLEANCDSPAHDKRQYNRPDDYGSSSHRSVVKHQLSDYESESAGYSSRSKQSYNRDFGESSSSRRYEVQGERHHRIKPEERSYRNRDRSRSDSSSSSSDRKSHRYTGYFDGYTYHGRSDSSHSRHRRSRYEADRNSSYRGGKESHTDSDASNKSYNSMKHKLQPYQRYM